MRANSSQFVGDIPANYQAGLGPVLFEDYARDLVERVRELTPTRVLELAAGTGVVSRKLRDALPERALMVITDLNAPMLDVARAKFEPGENVVFATSDAMKLDFPDSDFDLIVSQFGVMFFPDKRVAFREALRVLRPNGIYVFNTWATMEENPYARIVNEVMQHWFPENPPVFYRVPFSYGDPEVVKADAMAAGFTRVAFETVSLRQRVADYGQFSKGLIYGNPVINEINAARSVNAETVRAEVVRGLEEAFGPAPATMPLKAHVFACRA